MLLTKGTLFLCAWSVLVMIHFVNSDPSTPVQIHTIFADLPSSIIISWVSFEPFNSSILSVVKYGYSNSSLIYQAKSEPYQYFEFDPPARIIHNVRIDHLQIGKTVYYRCGTSLNLFRNETFEFKLRDFTNETVIKFASFGDFGIESDNPDINGSIYKALKSRMQSDDIYFILHMGDIAYDLITNNGTRGDAFLKGIEPIASSIPYMTGIGCHERDDRYDIEQNVSYGQYLNRFSGLTSLMQQSMSTTLHYYSWNVGLIHFISIDTDPWIYNNLYTGMYDRLYHQYNWLINDLHSVNRNKTPWIIIYGHRSIYCQKKSNDNECRLESYYLAQGIIDPVTQKPNSFPLEPLWNEYNVDLYLSGHTHHYERSWPVYKNVTVQKNYVNPTAPVYVLNGIGGVTGIGDELPNKNESRDWNAFMDNSMRRMFGMITVYNRTHLQYDAVDMNNNIFDTFIIQQNNHLFF